MNEPLPQFIHESIQTIPRLCRPSLVILSCLSTQTLFVPPNPDYDRFHIDSGVSLVSYVHTHVQYSTSFPCFPAVRNASQSSVTLFFQVPSYMFPRLCVLSLFHPLLQWITT